MSLSADLGVIYEVECLPPAWFLVLSVHTDGQTIVSESLTTTPLLPLQEGDHYYTTAWSARPATT
ncbi:hypothetical protein H6F94_13870 [Leptolyngbya sp. FACHB-261]|nr:hypothetical protein [Leptolyngbya sp. FACHB-261]